MVEMDTEVKMVVMVLLDGTAVARLEACTLSLTFKHSTIWTQQYISFDPACVSSCFSCFCCSSSDRLSLSQLFYVVLKHTDTLKAYTYLYNYRIYVLLINLFGYALMLLVVKTQNRD